MENRKLEKIPRKNLKKTILSRNLNNREYKLYTPEIITKYKNSLKIILKITNNKTKSKFLIYDKVVKWYEDEEGIDLSMEKIYIKTKLGSYSTGGCGIGASILAGLTASGVFSFIDSHLEKLNPAYLALYAILVLCFGLKILSNEDNKVEMYNMFLEVLNNLQNDKNENIG